MNLDLQKLNSVEKTREYMVKKKKKKSFARDEVLYARSITRGMRVNASHAKVQNVSNQSHAKVQNVSTVFLKDKLTQIGARIFERISYVSFGRINSLSLARAPRSLVVPFVLFSRENIFSMQRRQERGALAK